MLNTVYICFIEYYARQTVLMADKSCRTLYNIELNYLWLIFLKNYNFLEIKKAYFTIDLKLRFEVGKLCWF